MPFQIGEPVTIRHQGARRWTVIEYKPSEDVYLLFNDEVGGVMSMPEAAIQAASPLPSLGSRIWMGTTGVMGTVVEHKLPNRVVVRVVEPRLMEFTGDELMQMTEVNDEE